MQGWHYGKGLIYLRPIFRLTKLAFLKARAILKADAAFLIFNAFLMHFACRVSV